MIVNFSYDCGPIWPRGYVLAGEIYLETDLRNYLFTHYLQVVSTPNTFRIITMSPLKS